MPQADGRPLIEHLRAVKKSTRKEPRGLKGPPAPEVGGYLLSFFEDMQSSRKYGPSGPLPLDHQEMLAWSVLYGIKLTPWEVATIKELDRAFVESWFENQKNLKG